MKKILLILWLSIVAALNVMSQTSGSYAMKRDDILYLYMNPHDYAGLSEADKKTFLETKAGEFDVKTVYVVCAYKGELWQIVNGTLQKTDSWDKDASFVPQEGIKETSVRSLKHPWFVNVSGVLGVSSGDVIYDSSPGYINVSGSLRAGCYLLKGRWDLAFNFLGGYNKTFGSDEKGSFNGSVGLDTRGYILKGKAVNPFVGVGASYSFGDGESSFNIPVSAGLNIPVRSRGCIDVSYQWSKATKSVVIVGWTVMF